MSCGTTAMSAGIPPGFKLSAETVSGGVAALNHRLINEVPFRDKGNLRKPPVFLCDSPSFSREKMRHSAARLPFIFVFSRQTIVRFGLTKAEALAVDTGVDAIRTTMLRKWTLIAQAAQLEKVPEK